MCEAVLSIIRYLPNVRKRLGLGVTGFYGLVYGSHLGIKIDCDRAEQNAVGMLYTIFRK